MECLPVLRIPLPTPFAVGDVNAYVIKAEPLTLVDTGTATIDAENALKIACAAEGLFLEGIRRIVVTHAHPDHYGLGPRIQEISGAEILVGDKEIDKVREGALWWELGRLLLEAGIPYEVLMEMAGFEKEARRMHPAVADAKPVSHGDRLSFDDGFALEVHHFAGHTGGHICLYEPQTGTMFAGDTLLPTITPNPVMEADPNEPGGRRRSLVQYLASLERLERMDLRIVYPGHGDPITDAKALIRSYREHHEKRSLRIANMLGPEGKSAYQLANEMYPDRDLGDKFLATGEILAHIDILIDRGEAELVPAGDVMLFRRR